MGGPPVRGDILALWRPGPSVSADEREAWKRVAQSITLGLELVARLEPILSPGEL